MKIFITAYIDKDIKEGRTELAFRFPPEPNGCLHLGHAKSIIINSYLAKKYDAKLYLRLDDTNPETETVEFERSIVEDANWLTLKPFCAVTHTSDYFGAIFAAAVHLIEKGLAYVDFSTELKSSRGGFTAPDVPSIYRDASVAENLERFNKMREGGAGVLRAKIDLAHPNMNMRDPVMYRAKSGTHYRTGNDWLIYPMYDFAHPLGDCIERISHSLCTLEFEDHRVLYNWYVDNCFDIFKWRPVELEFSRLDIEGVSLSKRKLKEIVDAGTPWNSPKLPTISGMRAKGINPEVLLDYILKCGVTKVNTLIPGHFLTDSIKSIYKKSDRIFAIIDPVELHFNNPIEDFPKTVWIDRADVRAVEEPDFWRVYPGNWVRLKNGYNFCATDVGAVVRADIDATSRHPKEALVKARAALHWLSDYKKITAAFYETEYKTCEILIAPDYKTNCIYEFERVGYFYIDESHVAHHLAYL